MKDQLPKITVITPVFNGEKYILETVKSVISVIANRSVEYIVVDDGSRDKTLQILETFGRQIHIVSQPNGGESAAVNTGLRTAQGEYILVVNSDDPLPNGDIFEGVDDFFVNNPTVVAWYPSWKMIDDRGSLIVETHVLEYSDELMIGESKCLPGPGTIFRKDVALKIGGRDKRWRFVSDFDFWLRLSREGTLVKREGILAQWRSHDGATSVALRGRDMAKERIEVIENFVANYKIKKSLEDTAISSAYYSAALLSFYSKDVPAKRYLIKALSTNRRLIKGGKVKEYLYIALLPFSRIAPSLVLKFFPGVVRFLR
jgi:glycosyltransferase involved in cell wall biosynthesis